MPQEVNTGNMTAQLSTPYTPTLGSTMLSVTETGGRQTDRQITMIDANSR